jgi:anti-sigma B factor antagonist
MVIAEPVGTQLVILEPNGRLTAETVDEFNQTVSKWVRRGWHDLILDLRYVTYLDSAGIGVLAQLHLSSQRRGSRAVFVNVAGKTHELLRITKLLTVFEVYDSTAEAERSFSRPSETVTC